MDINPFDLNNFPQPLRWIIRRIGRFNILGSLYHDWMKSDQSGVENFLRFTLKRIGRPYEVQHLSGASDIPKDKPLIIVSNHPLGALEGMMLALWLLQHRPDLKVLTNELLLELPEFKELFIGVDVLSSQRNNKAAIKKLDTHLQNNGAVLIFPAGTVGDWNAKENTIDDAPWRTSAAKLALKHDAYCLPIHTLGRNDQLFYMAGWISKRLRTVLLPRAMLANKSAAIKFTVGASYQLTSIEGMSSCRVATDYMRLTVELTGSHHHQVVAKQRKELPIVEVSAPLSLDYLQQYQVLKKDGKVIFCAPYDKLGPLAQHLAAERERTFRAAGEGTGKALDIDMFDSHYWHIFAWDMKKDRLIGAYRAYKVSDAIAANNLSLLYSYSLFEFKMDFLNQHKHAIEVGRSFVTEAYQADPRALDLLWQGLGAFMLRNPDCHTFFGCVSISNSYVPVVRSLLQDTLLSAYRVKQALYQQVNPHIRLSHKKVLWNGELLKGLCNVSAINKLLGHAGLMMRVPILIRHYLALNGRFVDFTINESFNNSLDGLIVVDLRKAPSRYLKRYFGKDNVEPFYNRWSSEKNVTDIVA